MHFDICPVCGDYIGTTLNDDGTQRHCCMNEDCNWNDDE